MAKPDKLRIPYEDFKYARFDCVGRLPDGTQFMGYVTGAWPTGRAFDTSEGWRHRKTWIAVVHQFDADGNHIRSQSRLGGPDIQGRKVACDKAQAHRNEMLAELFAEHGPPEYCDIWVRMFSVEVDGVTHKLFFGQWEEEPEPGEERLEWVRLESNDIEFHPPWNSGDYST